MKYAIIYLGGKQIKITEGQKFDIEKQTGLDFDVLYYTDGKEILIGEPKLDNITIKAKIIEDKKDKKIRVGRFKSKSRYRRVQGHRQPLSVIEIESITKKGAKAEPKEEKKEVKKETPKKTAAKKTTTKKATTKKETKVKSSKKESK